MVLALPPGEDWNFFFIDQLQISKSQTDDEFVLTRAIRLHEIHHTIIGLPITVAGKAAASAYYASTLSTSSLTKEI